MSCVCQAGWQAILRGKNFHVEYYWQTFLPKFFTPGMLIGTLDFYHFTPLSLTLTFTGGHKVSTKHFLAHFSTDQNEICFGVEAI